MDNKAYDPQKEAYTLGPIPRVTLPSQKINGADPRDNQQDQILLPEEETDQNHGQILEKDQFENLEWEPTNFVSRGFQQIQTGLGSVITDSKNQINIGMVVLVFVLYNAYLITAIEHNVRNEMDILWCDGLGFLIILTAIVYWSLFYYHVIQKYFGKAIYDSVFQPVGKIWDSCWNLLIFKLLFAVVLIGGLLTFLIIDSKDNRRKLISAAGIPILILIGVILSKNPARIVWRHVFWGVALQFLFGLLILRWTTGQQIVDCISTKVRIFLEFTNAGSSFVYGYLASGYNSSVDGISFPDPSGGGAKHIVLGGVFAFSVLSVIFFFSFCIAILYSTGAMTWAIVKMGWLLQITMGTTAVESMSASANIILGQTEAPIAIKPFIKSLTNSELHSIMTGGFATVAGTTLGAYISFGIDASHLLTASFMSAPAALAFAKLMYPETKKSKTTSEEVYKNKPNVNTNALDAASDAASQASGVVMGIVSSLIAFLAFVAFIDAILTWGGGLVGVPEFSFSWIMGKLFYPLAFIIGVCEKDLEEVAQLLGKKTFVNEFIAYIELGESTTLSDRSRAITTYALCSFANFGSIGIQLGFLGALVPERRKDLSTIIWRAFIAGNAAALMTACVAGTLIEDVPGVPLCS